MICPEEGGKTIKIWQKGRRTKYTVAIEDVWRLGLRSAMLAAREEKMRRRMERRSRRG
jgi:hypothetical protein